MAPLGSLTLREIMDFRTSLEPPIAYNVAKNASQKQLDELWNSMQAYKQLTKEQRVSDTTLYINMAFQAEVDFHTKLAQICTNALLRNAYLDNMPQIMRTIYFFSRYYGLTEDGGDAAGDFYKTHQHIFYCLQAGAGRMAMEATFSHLHKANLRAIQLD